MLFPSLTLKYLALQSINCKTTVTHNNFGHCRVRFYPSVRPLSKKLYTAVSREVVLLQKRKSEHDNIESYYVQRWFYPWSIEVQGISAYGEGSSTNTCIHAFCFLFLKHCEPQPSSASLKLPTIPIRIVACAFLLLWDNLCRNSCTRVTRRPNAVLFSILRRLGLFTALCFLIGWTCG